jgi:LacI family transcriptional regulator
VRTGHWSEAWGREGALSLLAEVPDVDAVYCGSDLIARGVLDACRQLGRDVPGEVAVVGTDNWQLVARAARPPLTTVDMRLDGVGRLAASLLIQAIEGQPIAGTYAVAPELVVRASTGFPYDDPTADAPRNYHDFCIHQVT